MSYQDTSYLYPLSFYHPAHPSCLHFPHSWTRTTKKSVTREHLQGRHQHPAQRYSNSCTIYTILRSLTHAWNTQTQLRHSFKSLTSSLHPASCITLAPYPQWTLHYPWKVPTPQSIQIVSWIAPLPEPLSVLRFSVPLWGTSTRPDPITGRPSPMPLSTWRLRFMLGSAGYSFGDQPSCFIGYDRPDLLCKWHFYLILTFTDTSDTRSCPYRKTKSLLWSWRPPSPLRCMHLIQHNCLLF